MRNSVPRYIVMTSSAKMPSKVKSPYKNVAVIETDGEGWPKFIGERAIHTVRVVDYRGPLNVGSTPRSAFYRACAEAEALANKLNNGETIND